jgi:hypothetical protein
MSISEASTTSTSALSFVVGTGDARVVAEHYSRETPPVHYAAALLGFVPGSIGGKFHSVLNTWRSFVFCISVDGIHLSC